MWTETCSNHQIKLMLAVRLLYFYFYCCVDGQIPPIMIHNRIPPKRRLTCNVLHGDKSQKREQIITSAVRTSNHKRALFYRNITYTYYHKWFKYSTLNMNLHLCHQKAFHAGSNMSSRSTYGENTFPYLGLADSDENIKWRQLIGDETKSGCTYFSAVFLDAYKIQYLIQYVTCHKREHMDRLSSQIQHFMCLSCKNLHGRPVLSMLNYKPMFRRSPRPPSSVLMWRITVCRWYLYQFIKSIRLPIGVLCGRRAESNCLVTHPNLTYNLVD
jgi:hypothetical protein